MRFTSVPSSPHLKRPQRASGKAVARPGMIMSICVASAALVLGMAPAQGEEYRLGAQDRVRIKVFEWRASRDTVFEWTALNDVFIVSSSGALSLPLAGEVGAAGRTTAELASAIGDSLVRNMGLGRKPDTAVEVVQYRPFYILGQVTQSGEFAYRPGLTVMQALGIAGGIRLREERMDRYEREIIQGQGEAKLIGLNKINLLARKARLGAELAQAASIDFPPQLVAIRDDDEVALLMRQEESIFKARREGIETQVRALRNLRDFLEKEVTSLGAQLVFLDKQVELVQKELGSVASLVERGLAAAPRELSLERALAQIQSERLAAETSLLRSRQEISRTEIQIIEMQDTRRNEITNALRDTQIELDALDRKAETTARLIFESELAAPRLMARRASMEQAEPIYTIYRPAADGSIIEIAATMASPVLPGDTVKVEIPMPTEYLKAIGSQADAPETTLNPASVEMGSATIAGTGSAPR
ncbi:polysaccharide biosynthesis/export family protein [Aquamicrobium sp.]|uniref:polysaccharide biosynthesis/export family protein n=1 Tax=Aquamicrobium sp. TaxID=1872579 RepID=UPI0025880236|nr:polysaccharide biosynthesis/export family protein [Aquamicrobium sp.]MCK9553124.1 polysaccharide biosynthesis/export family protein [Aquamicrobium sp.]